MPSKIVIVGGSGLIGSLLKNYLSQEGYDVTTLSHNAIPALMPAYAVVINLAGAGIFRNFWTKRYKKEIIKSRIETTKRLVKALSPQTKLFISASGIGYYGDRGFEIVTETSKAGSSFLSEVSEKWEEASQGLTSCRRVVARISPVLTPKSGFLGPLRIAFKLGLGAKIGSGEQWQSWIHYTDLARAFVHIIQTTSLKGPVIIASPEPVRQKRFAKQLAKILHRPLFLRIPSSLIRLLPGGMGQELFLHSVRPKPSKLIDSGFHFLYPHLGTALNDLLS